MRTNLVALLCALLLGFMLRDLLPGRALAELPPLDRPLIERIARAQETQAHAAEAQVRALEALTREVERCRR